MCDERKLVPVPDLLADYREKADPAHPEFGHDANGEICFDVKLKNKIQERMKAADIYPTRSDWRLAFILMRD